MAKMTYVARLYSLHENIRVFGLLLLARVSIRENKSVIQHNVHDLCRSLFLPPAQSI